MEIRDKLEELADWVAIKAEALKKVQASEHLQGTWGWRVLKVRIHDYESFLGQLEAVLNDEDFSAGVPVKGPGPYPGPCEACAMPMNSYERLCRYCRGIDDDHYIDANDRINLYPLKMRDGEQVQRTVDLEREFALI